MFKRWLRGVVVLALAATATATFGLASPAWAVDDLYWQSFDYSCTTTAGERSVSFVIWPPVDQIDGGDVVEQTGVITALSITGAPWREHYGYPITPVGSIFGKETLGDGWTRATTASGSFFVDPGPATVTVSMSVHWDNFRSTGPQNVTTTRTLALGSCQPIPLVSFASQCIGSLRVTFANGDNSQRAGGTVVFQIQGTDGYTYQTSYGFRPYESAYHDVPPYAAGSVTVKANNVEVARGAYVAAPGCAGYVGQPGTPNQGGGQSGGGTGGGASGGGNAGTDSTGVAASAEPSATAGTTTPTPSGSRQLPARTTAAPQLAAGQSVSAVAVGIGTGLVVVTAVGVLAVLFLRRRFRTRPELSE